MNKHANGKKVFLDRFRVPVGILISLFPLAIFQFIWALGASISGVEDEAIAYSLTAISAAIVWFSAFLILRKVDAASAVIFTSVLTFASVCAGGGFGVSFFFDVFGMCLVPTLVGFGLMFSRGGRLLPNLRESSPMYQRRGYQLVLVAAFFLIAGLMFVANR